MVPAGTKCRIAYTLLLVAAGLAPQRVIAQAQRTLLYELDVTDFDPFSEGSDWVSSTIPDLDILGELDTDTVTFDTPTLFMGSNPFQFMAPQGPMGQFNHIKHGYTYQQDLVPLAGNASIIDVEGSVYCQTTGVEQHPFGDAVTDADADLRLANCVFGVVDRTQFLSFDVSITNTAVYALYWMFPFTLGQPGQENFLSFGGAKKLMDKTPEDLVSVTLRFDMAENTVTYLVDGEAALVIDRPGMLPAADQEFSVLAVMNEGPEIEFQLGMLQPVLGLLTDLDMADPVLHQSGACGFFPAGNPTPQLPVTSFQPPPRECAVGLVPLYATEEGELLNRFPFIWMDATARNNSLLWGQGSEMWVSNLSAYQVSTDIVETD